MATYRALVGIEFGSTRVEEGETSDAIPAKSITWLLKDGFIELVEDSKPSKKKATAVAEDVEESE
jgi:hypothetical protein